MNSETIKDWAFERIVVGPLQTNCYIVYDKETKRGILIDPGDYTPGIDGFIKKHGISIINIVNTHGHADHISGNSAFKVPVLIHRLDSSLLNDPVNNLSFSLNIKTQEVPTIKLLADGDVIELDSIILKVIHTPGHTPGSICLKSGSILFSGDTLFCEGIGRTNTSSDYAAILKSIKDKLFVLPDDVRVFPGHGPETTIGHEKKQ